MQGMACHGQEERRIQPAKQGRSYLAASPLRKRRTLGGHTLAVIKERS